MLLLSQNRGTGGEGGGGGSTEGHSHTQGRIVTSSRNKPRDNTGFGHGSRGLEQKCGRVGAPIDTATKDLWVPGTSG